MGRIEANKNTPNLRAQKRKKIENPENSDNLTRNSDHENNEPQSFGILERLELSIPTETRLTEEKNDKLIEMNVQFLLEDIFSASFIIRQGLLQVISDLTFRF